MPAAAIDLFTDHPVVDPVFDRIRPLERSSHRPKMEALRRSRFDRTIYLDCDILAVADVSDIFEVLNRFDLVGAHENKRNGNVARQTVPGSPPNAFPQINSGVLGLRKSPATAALLTSWETAVHDGGHRRDQPILRKLLYESDIRIHILPFEYNLMQVNLMLAMGPGMTAPRLLHRTVLHAPDRDPGDPMTPYRLEEAMRPAVIAALRRLLATDRSLGGTAALDTGWPKGIAATPRDPDQGGTGPVDQQRYHS